MVDTSPDPMVVVRDGGAILHVNAHAERIFGYSRPGLIGAQSELLFPVRYRNRHIAHRTAYFDNPRPSLLGSGLVLTGLHQDGTEFCADVALSPYRIEGQLVIAATIRKSADVPPEPTAVFRRQETLQHRFNLPNTMLDELSRDVKRKKIDNELFVFDVAHGLPAPRIVRHGAVAN